MLIGNKSDLADPKVSEDMGKKLGNDIGVPFFPTSAKSNIGVNDAVMHLANEIYERKLYLVIGNAANVRIGKNNKKKNSCCKN